MSDLENKDEFPNDSNSGSRLDDVQTAVEEGNTESMVLKEEANALYRAGDYSQALQLFTAAIAVDETNHVLYCNRAMCFGALKDWIGCIRDSKRAVQLHRQHAKAHCWLVRGLLAVSPQRLREARHHLLVAYQDCGAAAENNPQFKQLETEASVFTPLRPRPADFEILDELGDGNFSKIYQAKLKTSGALFAIKTIEVMTVDRMKKRHRNIHNEILMEKRALTRLNHPHVVQLYATFKDYGSLYYQMEFLPGGELWSHLQEKDDAGQGDGTFGLSNAVGLPLSIARFVMAEALDALEYMHNQGIVHRDIKPENILFTADGHIKFVDFGTAKDLMQTDLNGPEFVGTPEYMSPGTVNSRVVGPEGDLWSLGVVLYQMLTGVTPFAAPSPYLGFLRTKRGLLRAPAFVSEHEKQLLRLLLTRDPQLRLASTVSSEGGSYGAINYDALRGLPFFTAHAFQLVGLEAEADTFPAALRSMHQRAAVRVPTLQELSRRAVGRACVKVASIMAEHGGVSPDAAEFPHLAWVGRFGLAPPGAVSMEAVPAQPMYSITSIDREYIIHYLTRRQQINNPGLYRLFWRSAVDAKCIRHDRTAREYLGYNRNTHGIWKSSGHDKGSDRSGPGGKDRGLTGVLHEFAFAHLGSLAFGADAASAATDAESLRKILSSVNRLRPKFVVASGNFTASSFSEGDAEYGAQRDAFRRCIARVSDSIPIMFVPGEREMGLLAPSSAANRESLRLPTRAAIEAYHAHFGLDFYGFWFNGIRCLVVNSSLFFVPQVPAEADVSADVAFVAAHAALQDSWFAEEIDQAKLCSTQLFVFSSHPWFCDALEEEYRGMRVIPPLARRKWLRRLQHARATLVLSQETEPLHMGNGASPAKKQYCFPNAPEEARRRAEARLQARKEAKAARRAARHTEADTSGQGKRRDDKKTPVKPASDSADPDWVRSVDEAPLLPSQMIANARARGEIPPADAAPALPDYVVEEDDRGYVCAIEGEAPPALPPAENASASSSDDEGSQGEGEGEEEGEHSDGEQSGGSDFDGETRAEGESKFKNVDKSLRGPEVIRTSPAPGAGGGLRLVRVTEETASHRFFLAAEIPTESSKLEIIVR